MNVLPREKRELILHLLVEGCSQRSISRVTGTDLKSVVKLFREAGDWAIAYLDNLTGLEVDRIEADELQSFVGTKRYFAGARPKQKKKNDRHGKR